jgi:hypothetical protein
VRGDEPQESDQLGPGAFLRFVKVVVVDAPPMPYSPVRDATIGLKCYGLTYSDARAFGMTCEAVFRDRGSRATAAGLGIWHSNIISSSPDIDPDTKQPLWSVVVRYPVTIAAVRTP